MSKAQVLRRSFSLWNRRTPPSIIRSAARTGHGTVRVQRVRIVRPFLDRRRLIGAAFTLATAYSAIHYLDSLLEEVDDIDEEEIAGRRKGRPIASEDEESDGWETVGEEEDEDEEDEEDVEPLLFLPTGLSRPKARTFYKGSDPEWQEFMRIAKDPELRKKIKYQVASEVRRLMTAASGPNSRLGVVVSGGNYSLDIIFPSGPPLEYEQPGFELREDLSIVRTTRPVDQVHHAKLNNLLIPAGAATSLFSHATEKIKMHWSSFKGALGSQNETKKGAGFPPELPPALLSSAASPSTTSGSPLQPPISHAPTSPSENATAKEPVSHTRLSTHSQGHTTVSSIFDLFSQFVTSPLSYLPPSSDLLLDLSTLRKTYKPQPMKIEPPRGHCVVTGMVRVVGSRSVATLDVMALYDPASQTHKVMGINVKHFLDHQQFPRGGP